MKLHHLHTCMQAQTLQVTERKDRISLRCSDSLGAYSVNLIVLIVGIRGKLTCSRPYGRDNWVSERPLESLRYQRSLPRWRICRRFVVVRTWIPDTSIPGITEISFQLVDNDFIISLPFSCDSWRWRERCQCAYVRWYRCHIGWSVCWTHLATGSVSRLLMFRSSSIPGDIKKHTHPVIH